MVERFFRTEAGFETHYEDVYETQVNEETGEELQVLVGTNETQVFVSREVDLTPAEIEEVLASRAAFNAKQDKEVILKQIADLEAQITDRRWREFAITGNKTFIENIENQITNLRNQLGE